MCVLGGQPAVMGRVVCRRLVPGQTGYVIPTLPWPIPIAHSNSLGRGCERQIQGWPAKAPGVTGHSALAHGASWGPPTTHAHCSRPRLSADPAGALLNGASSGGSSCCGG